MPQLYVNVYLAFEIKGVCFREGEGVVLKEGATTLQVSLL